MNVLLKATFYLSFVFLIACRDSESGNIMETSLAKAGKELSAEIHLSTALVSGKKVDVLSGRSIYGADSKTSNIIYKQVN